MRRRAAFWLLLLLPLLAGCWDRLEINDLAIVDMVGVDTAQNGLRLTVSVLVPSRAQTTPSAGGGAPHGGGSAAIIYTAEGKSVMDAMTKIQARLPRRLFWAHTRVLIIGEEMARSGVRPMLDFWSRHREPRLQMLVAISEGKAQDFVSASPRLEKLMSESLREILSLRLQTNATMKSFLAALCSETEQPTAPRVRLFPAAGGDDPQVCGTAVFQDDRLVGWLDEAETRGLLWLRGELRTGVVTLEMPTGGQVSMRLIRSYTTIRPDFRSGQLRISAHFEMEDDLYETSAPLDLGKEETIRMIEKALGREVILRVRRTLDKVQHELGADILMFGDAVNRNAPLRWEGGLKQRWEKVFPDVPVDITVSAHVRRTGEHSVPLGYGKERLRSEGGAQQKE